MDIDKSYMLGVSLNKQGIYQHWSPLADYTSQAAMEISDRLPLPTNIELVWGDDSDEGTNKVQVTTDNPDVQLVQLIQQYISTDDNVIGLQLLLDILNYVNTNKSFNITKDLLDNRLVRNLIIKLNKHNRHIITAEESKNLVARNINSVSTNAKNFSLSYSSIDGAMKLFKDALDKVFIEQQQMNLFDGISIHALQEINSVGKQTVGVMANGIKVFFALTQYYNQFYRNNPSAQDILDSYKWFNNKLTLLVNDEEGKEKRITLPTSFVADIRIIEERIKELSKAWADLLGNPERQLYYNNNTASLQQSSLISLATDNAKELALAKMNAGIKLASIHVYLTLLGVDPETIVQFTTSKPFNKFNEMIQSNRFVDGEEKRIDEQLFEEFLSWGNNNGYYEDCVQIMRLYKFADEITELARILGVNQGVKVDLFKANGLLTGFQSVLSNRIKDLHETLLAIRASQMPGLSKSGWFNLKKNL